MVDWITDDAFSSWLKDKEKEKTRTYEDSWGPKERGTTTSAKVYEGRFLGDPNGCMYKKYFYHMYQNDAGEWVFILCPKTYDFQDFCPLCYSTTKLWAGSERDKNLARKYKRKFKFVGNFYVIADPRDSENSDEEQQYAGKVYMYDFPGKIESKLDEELKEKDGLGKLIFDPGPAGFNFLIKVKSTSEGENAFPDYSDSTFARKATALGTDKEIAKIMETRKACTDWILNKFKENNWNRVKDSLEEAQLWTDSLAREWRKHFGEVSAATSHQESADEDEDMETTPPAQSEAPESETKEKEETKEAPKQEETSAEPEPELPQSEKDFLDSLDNF